MFGFFYIYIYFLEVCLSSNGYKYNLNTCQVVKHYLNVMPL